MTTAPGQLELTQEVHASTPGDQVPNAAVGTLIIFPNGGLWYAKDSSGSVALLQGVPTSRTVTAGAGLTGGGDLSANRTLNVVGNADGTITVNADDIQIGSLVIGNIANGLITLVKLATQASNTVLANNTGGSASPTAVPYATFKSALAIVPGDVAGFDAQVRTSSLNQMTAPTADLSINSHKLTSVTDGAANTDAATVGQMNTAINTALAGTSSRDLCKYATSAALPTVTYANGTSGVGATLTASAVGILTVDTTGIPVLNDPILVQNQASTFQNGIYTLTTVGTAIVPFVLTRRIDFDTAAEMQTPVIIPVDSEGAVAGTTNDDKVFLSLTATPFTVGTTGITFTPIGAVYTADGTSLQLSGTVFSEKDGGTTNTKLATMAANTVKGNITGSTAAPTDNALAANQFFARSSAGNITAKSMTDAGLAFVAAADVAAETALLNSATTSLKGLLDPADKNFLQNYNGSGIIFVTANSYSNLLCDGATDDLAALNTLASNAPDGSTLVWPGQNKTMVLSGAWSIPGGKHFRCLGGGSGGKTHVLQTSLTADHFTVNDWYSTFSGFDFFSNNTTTTAVQALTSGTVLTIGAITTALVPASGSINVGSAAGWQVLTYSARTSTTVTLSSTGTGNSIIGAPLVFKTAGAAINAGNNVGIDALDNSFAYVFNGYIASGTTANQSTIASNGFLNTINFDIQIDAANWNGIIDSNTCDCTVNSRSVSHCEINQCGSITGQGNQFIRGQYNTRFGSTTAAYPAGVFGVFFTNSYFDNAGIDAVKFQGISAIQRIKLTSCWLSSAAQKGVNFASTATTLPSDIELVGCNIYANGTDGIGGAGVADYKVIGGQVAGNTTNGFNIAPATGNVYSVLAQGVRIGPTGGFGANGTGINIAAGTYTQIKFADCDDSGNTTALTLGAVTVATASRFAITGCPGINPRGAVTTPGVPTAGTTVTNTTGFRVEIHAKNGGTAPAAFTVNGVAVTAGCSTVITTGTNTFFLDPGGTIAFTTTTVAAWAWTAN